MSHQAEFIKSAAKTEDLPRDTRPWIAVAGRSNAGKSSLINSLTGMRRLARVSAAPGRTALLNVFLIDRTVYLIDLPGYGYAQRSKKERARLETRIFDILTREPAPNLILLVADAATGLMPLDEELVAYVTRARLPYLIILNKIDHLSRTERVIRIQELKHRFPLIPVLIHSDVTKEGIRAIWEQIDTYLSHS